MLQRKKRHIEFDSTNVVVSRTLGISDERSSELNMILSDMSTRAILGKTPIGHCIKPIGKIAETDEELVYMSYMIGCRVGKDSVEAETAKPLEDMLSDLKKMFSDARQAGKARASQSAKPGDVFKLDEMSVSEIARICGCHTVCLQKEIDKVQSMGTHKVESVHIEPDGQLSVCGTRTTTPGQDEAYRWVTVQIASQPIGQIAKLVRLPQNVLVSRLKELQSRGLNPFKLVLDRTNGNVVITTDNKAVNGMIFNSTNMTNEQMEATIKATAKAYDAAFPG